MKALRTRRRTLIVVVALTVAVAFSALAWAGLSTSPFTLKPLAGLGSCPLGAVSQNHIP